MTQTTGFACPRCKNPLAAGANFCANCGQDISGVWGPGGEALGKTIAVEVDPNVDTLGELLSTATLGEYDIYGELGRGGMAAVYLGLDLALNRKVAIKTMLPELVSREGMVERFKREAQTSAGLSHPHIIQIFTVKQTKQLVYFVMKFIEGRSLESVIADKGPVSIDMAQVILSQVAGALAYAHKRHVVHRDIKPANIMIDEDGWAIVTDFGIAKVQEQQAQNLTATGTAIGTPHYMSPEQFHNKAVTGASDQYSLGIVAYEMLLGKKPFDGATYAEIITQHLVEPVPDVRQLRPDVPEHIAAAVKRMLAKDPAERFHDLEAAATELGTPLKKEGDVVRTQMISLVKNGPQKKVRMSVPMSPIPVTKRAAPTMVEKEGAEGGAATVVERARRARPKPQTKSRSPFLAVAAVLLLGVGGFIGWRATTRDKSDTKAPVVTPAGNETAAKPAADSTAASSTAQTSGQPAEPAAQPAASPAAPAPANTLGVAAVKQRESAALANRGGASVTLSNLPPGAVVTLDGRRQVGSQFLARAGTHDVRIVASGFEPMNRRVTLTPGERLQVTFDRRQRAATVAAAAKQEPAGSQGLATMRLILVPPALISIDGQSKGQQSRVIEEVVPGTHTLRVERDGWAAKDTVVTLQAGQTATIKIQLTERRP